MSHFNVIVCANDEEEVARLLASFQENNMDDCPDEFLKFSEVETEYKQKYENEKAERVVMPDGRLLSRFDDEFRVPGSVGTLVSGSSEGATHVIPVDLDVEEFPFTVIYPTFEEYMDDWHGFSKRDPDKKVYGYWENPDAKWDWFQIGGRWSGFFEPEYDPNDDPANTITCSLCSGTGDRPGWVSYEGRNKEGEVSYRYSSKTVLEVKIAESEKNPEEFSVHRKFKDDWAEQCNGCNACKGKGERPVWPTERKPVPADTCLVGDPNIKKMRDEAKGSALSFAMLTPEGRWLQSGDMGWWASVSNEDPDYDETFWQEIDRLTLDQRLYIVDCHI